MALDYSETHLSVPLAGRLLGVTSQTVYRWCQVHRLESVVDDSGRWWVTKASAARVHAERSTPAETSLAGAA